MNLVNLQCEMQQETRLGVRCCGDRRDGGQALLEICPSRSGEPCSACFWLAGTRATVSQCGCQSRDCRCRATRKPQNAPATTPVVLAIQSPSPGARPGLNDWPISKRAAAAARPIAIVMDCR